MRINARGSPFRYAGGQAVGAKVLPSGFPQRLEDLLEGKPLPNPLPQAEVRPVTAEGLHEAVRHQERWASPLWSHSRARRRQSQVLHKADATPLRTCP